MDLLEYREKIDDIDSQIVRLFEERMVVSEEIARYKIANGLKVLDSVREAQKIEAVREKAHGAFNRMSVEELYRQIMAISRKRQYQIMPLLPDEEQERYGYHFAPSLPMEGRTVVFQGIAGAYSHAATEAYFGEDMESHHIKSYHVRTWREAIADVEGKKADYAVLPIENSTAGIVADIYDLLSESGLYIVGQQVIRVDHVLLGLPEASLSDIREVISHPQALSQCKAFLESHPEWKTGEEVNTALSALRVKEGGRRDMAALASREAGKTFGLKVLAENVCANTGNVTRFIIVSRESLFEEKADIVSISFELPHESGSLYRILSHIIYNGLNMTRIESRPIPGRTWEYRFFVDFEGHITDSAAVNALKGIRAEAIRMRVLGNYRSYEPGE